MPSAFQSIHLYPELQQVVAQYSMLYAEACNCLDKMMYVNDGRVQPHSWKVLPVLPEPEDHNFISDAALQQIQLLVPQTVSLFASFSAVAAYAYAVLEPKAIIAAHKHHNPYITASLCLACGDDCFIRVNNEKRYYKKKEIIVFDYTQTHEVVNNSDVPRLVLLMLLPNREPNNTQGEDC